MRSDGETEISKIVCACRKYKLPFTFRAAGTSLSGQSCTDSVLIVAGKHWEKYSIVDSGQCKVDSCDNQPSAEGNQNCTLSTENCQLAIKLQPGIVGGRVNQILKPFGRVFPPDPASIGSVRF